MEKFIFHFSEMKSQNKNSINTQNPAHLFPVNQHYSLPFKKFQLTY